MTPKEILSELFSAAIAAADPGRLAAYLPAPPKGRTIVVGAGKAAAAMAAAVEAHWQGPIAGLVVTRYGHSVPTAGIRVVEAGHPMPDEAGSHAARDMLELVAGLTADDLVLSLISGGGSALLTLPHRNLRFADVAAVNAALLASGAPIQSINTVRKHLSGIAGGRLAEAARPARVVTLAISDVPGDDIAAIASGPTVPDPTTLADARAIIERYRLPVPEAVIAHLADPAHETPKRLENTAAHLIARPIDALESAAKAAARHGLKPILLSDRIEGEAAAVAQDHAKMARALSAGSVILSGGEVTVTGAGRESGGPNREFALALAIALGGAPGVSALAADSDGIDGSSDAAGGFVFEDSLARAAKLGIDAKACLAGHHSGAFFAALGDALVTGPTRTNVNDFRAILKF